MCKISECCLDMQFSLYGLTKGLHTPFSCLLWTDATDFTWASLTVQIHQQITFNLVILSSLHHRIVHHQIFPRSSTHGGQLSVSTFWFSLAYCPFFLRLLVWIIMVREEDTNKHRTVSLRRFALICILQHGKRHLSTKTFVSAVQLLKDRRELRVFVRSSWQKREEILSLQ